MPKTNFKRGLKYVLGFLLVFISIFTLFMAAGFWWANLEFKNSGPLLETKIIAIERGSGLNAIAQKLKTEEAITSPYVFILGARLMNAQSDLKAGEYELPAHISPRAILEKIKNGDVYVRRVTIPEGKTSYEIVQILKALPDLSGEIIDIPPEGSLFPSAYDYKNNEARADILERMTQNIRREVFIQCGYLHDALDWDSISKMSFKVFSNYTCPEDTENKNFEGFEPTILNVLTLASIVEKETGVPAERKTIAGVFINRLRTGMPLQTDPTVIYAMNKGVNKNDGLGPLGRRLLSKDLEIDSPYNTYKNPGLPPGPIANPGKESIAAVLNPENNDYFYFVADGTGGHIFSKTLAEHNASVAKWRKIRKEKGL